MKISWLKYEKDKDSFKMPEALGLDVYKLHDLEDSDKMLEKQGMNNLNIRLK